MLAATVSAKATWGLSSQWAALAKHRQEFEESVKTAETIKETISESEAELITANDNFERHDEVLQDAVWLFEDIALLMESALHQFGSDAAGKALHRIAESVQNLQSTLEFREKVTLQHAKAYHLQCDITASLSSAVESQSKRIEILQSSLDTAIAETDDMKANHAWTAAYVKNVMHERTLWQERHGMNSMHLEKTKSFVASCEQSLSFLPSHGSHYSKPSSTPQAGDNKDSVATRYLARLEINNTIGESLPYIAPREELALLRGLLESTQDTNTSFEEGIKSVAASMDTEKSRRLKFIQAVATTFSAGITKLRVQLENMKEEIKSSRRTFHGVLHEGMHDVITFTTDHVKEQLTAYQAQQQTKQENQMKRRASMNVLSPMTKVSSFGPMGPGSGSTQSLSPGGGGMISRRRSTALGVPGGNPPPAGVVKGKALQLLHDPPALHSATTGEQQQHQQVGSALESSISDSARHQPSPPDAAGGFITFAEQQRSDGSICSGSSVVQSPTSLEVGGGGLMLAHPGINSAHNLSALRGADAFNSGGTLGDGTVAVGSGSSGSGAPFESMSLPSPSDQLTEVPPPSRDGNWTPPSVHSQQRGNRVKGGTSVATAADPAMSVSGWGGRQYHGSGGGGACGQYVGVSGAAAVGAENQQHSFYSHPPGPLGVRVKPQPAERRLVIVPKQLENVFDQVQNPQMQMQPGKVLERNTQLVNRMEKKMADALAKTDLMAFENNNFQVRAGVPPPKREDRYDDSVNFAVDSKPMPTFEARPPKRSNNWDGYDGGDLNTKKIVKSRPGTTGHSSSRKKKPKEVLGATDFQAWIQDTM